MTWEFILQQFSAVHAVIEHSNDSRKKWKKNKKTITDVLWTTASMQECGLLEKQWQCTITMNIYTSHTYYSRYRNNAFHQES